MLITYLLLFSITMPHPSDCFSLSILDSLLQLQRVACCAVLSCLVPSSTVSSTGTTTSHTHTSQQHAAQDVVKAARAWLRLDWCMDLMDAVEWWQWISFSGWGTFLWPCYTLSLADQHSIIPWKSLLSFNRRNMHPPLCAFFFVFFSSNARRFFRRKFCKRACRKKWLTSSLWKSCWLWRHHCKKESSISLGQLLLPQWLSDDRSNNWQHTIHHHDLITTQSTLFNHRHTSTDPTPCPQRLWVVA